MNFSFIGNDPGSFWVLYNFCIKFKILVENKADEINCFWAMTFIWVEFLK